MVTGVAAVGAESVVFLESAAWYILSSAYLLQYNFVGTFLGVTRQYVPAHYLVASPE